MSKPTIKDVATRAGVGVGTVSRVINGGNARPQTRQRVLAAIQELGFRPDEHARALGAKRTRGETQVWV
jgi:LacI family transcriptional regulator